MLKDFNTTSGTPGAGLRLKAGDFAYLRDLGVYPINRMAILRRFPIGISLTENLEEMTLEPISTVIGWIKPDANFGTISFNENWGKTTKRFDQLLSSRSIHRPAPQTYWIRILLHDYHQYLRDFTSRLTFKYWSAFSWKTRASFKLAGVAWQGFFSSWARRGVPKFRTERAAKISRAEGWSAVLKPWRITAMP